MKPGLASKLAVGTVTHQRYKPTNHGFHTTLYYSWIHLAEIEALDALPLWSTQRFNLVQFKRQDYIRPLDRSMEDAVALHLQQAGIEEIPHSIYLLTHLRQWGMSFNPVSFYFCFREDKTCIAVLSDITNTPWDERHVYVHRCEEQSPHFTVRSQFAKAFHISPFMAMNMNYDWSFRFDGESVVAKMDVNQNNERHFNASMKLALKPLTKRSAAIAPLRFPFTPLSVLFKIYWHALRLWLKGTPIYDHPSNENAKSDLSASSSPPSTSSIKRSP